MLPTPLDGLGPVIVKAALHLLPIPSLRTIFALFCFAVVLLVADRIRRQAGLDSDLDVDTLAVVPFEIAWGRFWTWMTLAGYSKRTISDYHRVLHDLAATLPADQHGLPRWNARNLERLVHRWLAAPARTGPRRGMPLSVATRKHYLSAAKSFYRFAATCDPPMLARDRLLGVRGPTVYEGPARDIPTEELAGLLEDAQVADERLGMIVWLAWAGGLRCKEIAGARIEHVELDGDQISLLVTKETAKGGRPRLVPLHSASHPFVRAYLARRTGSGPLVEARDRAGDYNGGHLAPGTVSKIVSRWAHEQDLDATAHRLRHTIATMMYAVGEGTNLEHVAEFLGVEPRTARRYAKGYKLKVKRWLDEVADPRAV